MQVEWHKDLSRSIITANSLYTCSTSSDIKMLSKAQDHILKQLIAIEEFYDLTGQFSEVTLNECPYEILGSLEKNGALIGNPFTFSPCN